MNSAVHDWLTLRRQSQSDNREARLVKAIYIIYKLLG